MFLCRSAADFTETWCYDWLYNWEESVNFWRLSGSRYGYQITIPLPSPL